MARCSFCNENIERGTGFIYVLTEGKVLDFCSRKCEKYMLKFKRKAIHTKWTEVYDNKK